jgi:hypothetical protein
VWTQFRSGQATAGAPVAIVPPDLDGHTQAPPQFRGALSRRVCRKRSRGHLGGDGAAGVVLLGRGSAGLAPGLPHPTHRGKGEVAEPSRDQHRLSRRERH